MANLVTSVRRSVKNMHWLEESDRAAVDLALRYAQTIEDRAKNGTDEQASKALGWLGPHLLNTIKAIGGTPAERRAIGAETQAKGRLAELRALRGGRDAG